MAFWRKKMAKKEPQDTKPAPPKPVLAVEYNGNLYPTLQSAEGARVKADLMLLLCPPRDRDSMLYEPMGIEFGKRQTIDAVIKNAEAVHGALTRYLSASA
jgi:hypothetical protein